ncbi:MAG: hypothetical protein AMS24_04215 [Chlamydiae bacterium SM23_39]|nr:MAG: hypothetical protein AMS24_04215 [Chlamydiae bacterium SM23_39]
MKLSFSHLKNYVDLTNLSISDITTILTHLGIEVENIENEQFSFSGVISAQIESISNHPHSKNLKIVKISDGKKSYEIVCGALNCKVGLKTAFAKVGAVLTIDKKRIKIKKEKIKKIESNGLLCSKKDLKISLDESGIIELPDDMELGKDLSYLSSPILDLSLTPNLGHCLSYIGIARELAAYLNKKVHYPSTSIKTDFSLKTTDQIKIEIEDKKKCPRYSAMKIENIDIKPSPFWLSNYLESSGIRPINCIVDIMNFVMLEYGQPLHAFDFDKLEEIKTSTLKKEEDFLGLDEEKRVLKKGSIVIRDKKNILALAGILGGINSSINQNSKNILIESAIFDPISIRNSSKDLNLRTESSIRFEKMTDPNGTINALNRAAYLIKQIYPNCKIYEPVDIKEKPFLPKKISCNILKANKIIGINLSFNEIENIFQRLEFKTKKTEENILESTIPTYRNDIKQEIDLIEEIARIYGYHNIDKRPPYFTSSKENHDPLYIFEKSLKTLFSSMGMQEIITPDLISPSLAELIEEKKISKSSLITVLKPKSTEQSILRPSFLPSFLQITKYNNYHKIFDISAFEIGNIHLKKDENYFEQSSSAIILSGKKSFYHWKEKPKDVDFFDIKGIIENIFFALRIDNFEFKKSLHPSFHPGQQANIYIDNINIGVIGQIHPKIIDKMDIKNPLFFTEINNNILLKNKKDIKLKKISCFPSSERDHTFEISTKIPISTILEKTKKIKSDILKTTIFLDLYINPKNIDKRYITLRFIYQSDFKTISFEEVEREHTKIIKKITLNL